MMMSEKPPKSYLVPVVPGGFENKECVFENKSRKLKINPQNLKIKRQN